MDMSGTPIADKMVRDECSSIVVWASGADTVVVSYVDAADGPAHTEATPLYVVSILDVMGAASGQERSDTRLTREPEATVSAVVGLFTGEWVVVGADAQTYHIDEFRDRYDVDRIYDAFFPGLPVTEAELATAHNKMRRSDI